MNRLFSLFIFILLITVSVPSHAIPTALQNKIDSTKDQITTVDGEVQNVLSIIDNIDNLSTNEITVTQKDANKTVKNINRTVKKVNRTITAIRRRLRDLRQDPNFNETEMEIRELDQEISDLKEERQRLRAEKKNINKNKSVLPTGIKSLSDLETRVIDKEIICSTFEDVIAELLITGAQIGDDDLIDAFKGEFDDAKDIEKKIKKRLSKLFGKLNKTNEIRALQSLLRRIRTVKKKYKDVKDLEVPQPQFQLINDTIMVGPVICTLAGELQPSGFGTARVTCEFPNSAQRGLLRYTVDRGPEGFSDYGFATRIFGAAESQKLLSIDPCSGGFGLPVCEEAAVVFDAYNNGVAAFIEVEVDGEVVGLGVFSRN